MRKTFAAAMMAGTLILFGTPASSQPLDYGASLTHAQAKTVSAAAVAEAQKNGWKLAIAIVGPAGELVHFEKMDGTQNGSIRIAQGKARTSAMFKRPSKAFQDAFAKGTLNALTFPDVTASEGGVPIVIGGKIVGAIGTSGATGAEDGVASMAGAAAVK